MKGFFILEQMRQQMILLIDGYKLEIEARRATARLKQEQDQGSCNIRLTQCLTNQQFNI